MSRNAPASIHPDVQAVADAIAALSKSSSRAALTNGLEYIGKYFDDPNNKSVPETLRAPQ